MAKYKAYPEYKDSGMEWCTALPLGWKRTNLRWLSSIYAGGTPSKNVIDYWENGTIPWINSGAVNQSYVTEPSTFISKAAFENSSAKWIPKGALVVALAGQGKTKGMVAQLGIKTTCNQSMAAIVFYEINLSRYIYWWLTSNYQNIRNMAGGDLRDGLNLELLGDIQCPQPNDGECIRISAFLDHETAKIDNLIEKQQQLIELLKEKRQAVISHAVTKGLNPDVPMKDSGVEWLGEVPKHWVVSKVKYYCTIKGRIGFRGYTVQDLVDENEGALVLGASEMRSDGSIILNSPQYISWGKYYESPEIMLDKDMILFVQRGSTVGKVSFITHDLGKATINPSLIVLRDLNICGEFMSYSLMSSFIQNTVKMQTSSTAIPMISQEQVGNYFQLIPPLNEQLKIAEYIACNVSKIDQAINTAEISISLIKERRTALISAAVTGKIDVRNWVAPDTQGVEEPQEATA